MATTVYSPGPLPPFGTFTAKVDEKGRIKLPEKFLAYLAGLQANTVFITSINKVSVKIYTMECWDSTRKFLGGLQGEAAKAANSVITIANHFGESVAIDAQGRFLIPTTLRKLLQLESTSMHVTVTGDGMIDAVTVKVYDENLAKAEDHLDDKLDLLAGLGLK